MGRFLIRVFGSVSREPAVHHRTLRLSFYAEDPRSRPGWIFPSAPTRGGCPPPPSPPPRSLEYLPRLIPTFLIRINGLLTYASRRPAPKSPVAPSWGVLLGAGSFGRNPSGDLPGSRLVGDVGGFAREFSAARVIYPPRWSASVLKSRTPEGPLAPPSYSHRRRSTLCMISHRRWDSEIQPLLTILIYQAYFR